MQGPNAPATAVEHIIRAFGGTTVNICESEEWLVKFENKHDAMRTRDLITMLRGWSAQACVSTKNAIQIFND